MGGMSNILSEILVCPRVTLAAGFNEARVGDKGFRILPWEDVMKTVAVRAAGDQAWVAKALDLPVIALLVGFRCNQKNLIPFHHFSVAVTLLADLGMKLLTELNHLGFVPFENGNLMETMTIAAIRRIRISCQRRLAVDAVHIAVIGMAGGALLHDPGLLFFPGRHCVNILVAVLALDVIDEVDAGIMFRALFLVTTVAGDGLGVNPGPLGLDVDVEVDDIPVTAVARVRSMDRLSELLFVDLIPVTPQAFGIVDALDAIFPVFHGHFLILPFFDLARFGDFLAARRYCPPEWFETQEGHNKKDEKYQDEVLPSRFHGPPDIKNLSLYTGPTLMPCKGIKD